MIGARPSGAALARNRHPVAEAAEDREPAQSHSRRIIEVLEDSRADLRRFFERLEGDDERRDADG